MRRIFVSLVAVAAASTAALAQTSAPSQPMTNPGANSTSPAMNQSNTSGSGNAAVNDKPAGSAQTTGSVEPGSNSFTEGQARSRFEAQGFANVSELKKDDQGIWRGKAMRDGRQVSVSLDYKGTIQAQ